MEQATSTIDTNMTANSADPVSEYGAGLVVALEGFEGPIDLLLSLAREQKLDLAKMAILPLAEQYLAFIANARSLRLEVAADYLVMAAWLAFLKSRLLLPVEKPTAGEPNPAEMAEALRFQLLRLEAMQKAARQIQERPLLGVDVFMRGAPEEIEVEEKPVYFLPIQDLLSALAAPMRRRPAPTYSIAPMRLYSMEESVERLRERLGISPDWGTLQAFMPQVKYDAPPLERRSAVASSFAAVLELVKNGEIECRQDGTYAPIYLRRREASNQNGTEE